MREYKEIVKWGGKVRWVGGESRKCGRGGRFRDSVVFIAQLGRELDC